MKKLYFLFFLFSSIFANAQAPFITTWEFNDDDLELYTPLEINSTTNYTIDFGDGTILTDQTQIISHIYSNPGIYTVIISGNFNRIVVSQPDKGNIKTVEQWGDTVWTNMYRAFEDCSNLTLNASDVPDLSQTTNLTEMFKGASAINQPINNWDVSNITTMRAMFQGASSFNQPLNNWDVSGVTDMSNMFNDAVAFNQPINNWDVSGVTNMSNMFNGASVFNQPLNNWNTSNVIYMSGLFRAAYTFNQSLNNWDVSNCISMESMFSWASAFDQPLNNWNVSAVIWMGSMFNATDAFNQPLNNWEGINVTDMSYMFRDAVSFNQPINEWNVANVTNMREMFYNTKSFNQPLNNWDVSSVTNMNSMFYGAEAFNQPLGNWDVSKVKNMAYMFAYNVVFNGEIGSWNVNSVNTMQNMFSGAATFNQVINDWDVSGVNDVSNMFTDAVSFNQPLNNWNLSSTAAIYGMFYNAAAFNQNISTWNFGNFNFQNFLDHCGLDTDNYDSLLNKLVEVGIEGKWLGAEGLKYCDTAVRDYLVNEMQWTIQGDSLGEECSNNYLAGNLTFDQDNNGCTSEDIKVSNFLITANSGTFSYSSSTNEGNYNLGLLEGTYTIGLLNVPNYYTITPATSEITIEGSGNTETLNFCFTANETINDLNITLLPLAEARPGFETDYQLVVQNMGTQNVVTATVNLSFDDALQTFVSANPAPTTTTANELTFTITNLEPFQRTIIDLKTKLFEPPVVNGNEISNFTATITPNNDDFTPDDNTFNLAQMIVNSFDPNDKRVLQGEEIFESQTDDYLDYIIRFQNTGTASAIKVKINDVLSENLDWNTFQMVSSSHNCKVEIKEGNQVEFTFDNINLPNEAADEPGSHGFIAYKIKPAANLQIDDVINGNASSIYFDYNLPIITNATTTTIVEDIESLQISATVADVSCNGASDGSVTISVTGGSGSYTYAWSPSGGSEATATGLAAGNYVVTVIDSFGNTDDISVIVNEPEAINITNQPEDVAVIEGSDTVLSVIASNVEQYQWQVTTDGTNWDDISNGGTTPSYTGATTGTMSITGLPLSFDGYKYRVRLSNGVNCYMYSAEVNVDINTASMENYDYLDIKIYPNPSKSLVFANIPDAISYANLKISVLDINGRTLLEEPISDNLKNVDISNFESGIYIFTITSDKFRFSRYIIRE
ncbi:BspA family leucine-rich repeat surface protein [Flavobacterium sp. NRK1]|uniref:BspA family leucine-rich repeat surface protein n=1 Tax=Flavobacterium sp. NRK1 TaxID=2954929 RepID=UPI002091F559|nr:BspA family leucine-rich repeat surface protein [Flavobacterium sp. NRK1]MCO6146459.1 BspA family leucine-rich repeat surface protein [Flavobacterium sp. NRK1]